MKTAHVGLFAGLVLGIVAIYAGFLALLGVAFLGGLGLVVGLVIDGRIDLSSLTKTDGRRR